MRETGRHMENGAPHQKGDTGKGMGLDRRNGDLAVSMLMGNI